MPELTFSIKGVIPSKKNSKQIFARRGKRAVVIPSKKHQNWHEIAGIEAKAKRIKPKAPIPRTKQVFIYFCLPDQRRRDLDNMATTLLDWMVDFGILAGDSWQIIPELHLASAGVDKANPHVDVKIVF